VRDAIANQKRDLLSASVMYTTHEPCIMCSYVIRYHRIARIVYGSAVEFVGGATSPFKVLETEHVPKWGERPLIEGARCMDQCIRLSEEYVRSLNES